MLSVKQQQLNLKYYMGYYKASLDAKRGAKMIEAIKSFQKEHALSSDGIWGKNTESKMLLVTKKIQTALNIKADGLIGTNTINAIKNFQLKNALAVDGIAGKKTLDKLIGRVNVVPNSSIYADFKNYKYISEKECRCKCCGKYCSGFPVKPYKALIDIAEKLRIKFGRAIIITSCVRCKRHNNNVGGVSNSRHTLGKGMDCYINGVSGASLKAAAYSLGARYSYIIKGNVIHFDI